MTAIGSMGAVIGRIAAIESRIGARSAPPATSSTTGSVTSSAISTLTTGDPAARGLEGFDQLLERAEGLAPAGLVDAFVPGVRAQPAVSPFGRAISYAPVSPSPISNGTLPDDTPFAGLFEAAAERWGVPAAVLAAVGHVESRFRTDAVSSAGAIGVMQFMPATAAGMGVDPTDPTSAIDGAARLLRQMQDRFGSLELALAAYNVGPGTIARAGGIVPGSQSEKYVDAVLTASEQYS